MPQSRTHHRALLVIDVQNEYVSGALPIEYPPLSRSLANIARAIDHARQSSVPVVVVRHVTPVGSPLFARGSHGARLHEVVASRLHDHLVDKTLPSAFVGTDLADWLAAHEIDTVTVLGYMTHNCVDATIRQALHMGLEVEFLHDASGSVSYANRAGRSRAEDIHHAFSVVLQSRFAAVLGTDEWIAAVNLGIEPERDSIYWSHARGQAAFADAAARGAADPATVPIA